MSQYQTALEAAIKAAKEAGDLLRKEFHRPGGPRGTAHHAEVDEIAERLIRQQLLAAKPWSYLGEETGSASGDPDFAWIVDPNDGTAAFMKGRRGSSVSIAALHLGVPILGVVYSYNYPDDNGDLITWAEGCAYDYYAQTYLGYSKGSSGHDFNDWFNNAMNYDVYKPDCSGLANSAIWSSGDIGWTPKDVAGFKADTNLTSVTSPQPGDFWFYCPSKGIHMGIVTVVEGNTMWIEHTSSSQGYVTQWTNINYTTDSYWGTNCGGYGKRKN